MSLPCAFAALHRLRSARVRIRGRTASASEGISISNVLAGPTAPPPKVDVGIQSLAAASSALVGVGTHSVEQSGEVGKACQRDVNAPCHPQPPTAGHHRLHREG
jgi:hypothetical protein